MSPADNLIPTAVWQFGTALDVKCKWNTERASDDLAVLSRAAASLGLDLAALDAAVEHELVSVEGGRVDFRHPLARSAVYAEAGAGERRDVHGALA